MSEVAFLGCAFLRESCDGVRVEVRWTETHVRVYEHTLDGDVQLGLSVKRGDQAQELADLIRRGPPEPEPSPPPHPYDTQLEWLERCLREELPPTENVLEAVVNEATVSGPLYWIRNVQRRQRVLEIVAQLRALNAPRSAGAVPASPSSAKRKRKAKKKV